MKRFLIFLTVFLFCFVSSYSVNLTTDNLLYFSYDEDNTTGTSMIDLSGNGNNGTCTNMVGTCNTVTGLLINASEFDGINDQININGFNFGDTLTWSAWIYLDSLTTNSIIGYHSAQFDNGLDVSSDGSARIAVEPNGGTRVIASSPAGVINTNSWHLITGTYDGANIRIYVNDTLYDTQAQTGTLDTTSLLYRVIGSQRNNGYFNGSIDETGIWNRTLNITEIQQLYNNGTGFNPYTSLIPQTPQIQTNLSNFYKTTTINLNLTTTSNVNMSYSLNGASFLSICNLCNQLLLSFTAPEQNNNNISFRSENTNGFNWNNQTFTVDTTPPSIINNLPTEIGSYSLGLINSSVTCSDKNLASCTITFDRDGNTVNVDSSYTFTYNGNQTYAINATDSAGNSLIVSSSLLVNPNITFNFQDNSTNVVNYTFGGRSDDSGYVTYDIYNDGLVLGSNTLQFSKLGYILQNFAFTLTNTTNTNFTYNVSPAQINVNIYDRISGNLVTDNVNLQLIGNVGDNLSTTTGTAVLRAIDGIPGDYQIISSSTFYETESVYFTYTNQENITVDIYMIQSNASSLGSITIEVKDTLSFFIEGAIVNLLEWKPSQSSFISVAQCQTLSNGKCNLNIELNNKLYRFKATKGSTSAESSSSIISTDGLTIPITLQDIFLSAVANSNNILATFNETINLATNTSLLRLQWSTRDNTNARACITVFTNPGYSETIAVQNCSISSSGVLFVNTNILQPNSIAVDGTVADSFNTYLIGRFKYEGTGSLSKALNDYNIDILIPIIFFLLAIGLGLLFGNLYIGLGLGVISSWITTIIAANIITVGVSVVITFISMLVMWGTYKR